MRSAPLHRALLLLCAAATLPSCTSTPTQVIVMIDAEPAVRARADALQVIVLGRANPEAKGVVKLDERVELGDRHWPVRIALKPAGDDERRAFSIAARVYEGGEALAAASLTTGFVDGDVRWVRLILEDACLGLADLCDPEDNLTCHEGRCVVSLLDEDELGHNEDDATSTVGLLPRPGADGGGDAEPTVDGGVDGGPQPGPCPDVPEQCNDIDDDCDDRVDEELTRACGLGMGACERGTEHCSEGDWVDCVTDSGDPVIEPGEEACDAPGDEDCDDSVDEGCTCSGDETRRCGSDVGACEKGTQQCQGGTLGACEGGVQAEDESCDDQDNDCDDATDEDVTEACGSDVGLCVAGVKRCTAGLFGGCEGEVTPVAETCDLQDEDCDGRTDETLGCVRGVDNFGALFGGDPPVYDHGQLLSVNAAPDGSIALGGYACTAYTSESCDTWVARLNADRTLAWSRTYDSGYSGYQYFVPDQAAGVGFDRAGNLIAGGNVCNGGTDGSCDIWLRKYSPDGNDVLYTVVHDVAAVSRDITAGIAVDKDDNVVLAATITTADFNSTYVWLRKFDSAGGELWTKTYDSPAPNDSVSGVAVDSMGAVIISGSSSPSSESIAWVRKYDRSGNLLWAHDYTRPPGITYAQAMAVAVDSARNVFVVGTQSAMNVPITSWLLKYDFDGALRGTVPLTGAFEAAGVAADATDHVVVAGSQFAQGPGYDLWVRRFDPTLTEVWTRSYNFDNQRDEGFAVATDPSLNVLVVGYANGQDFVLHAWGP